MGGIDVSETFLVCEGVDFISSVQRLFTCNRNHLLKCLQNVTSFKIKILFSREFLTD